MTRARVAGATFAAVAGVLALTALAGPSEPGAAAVPDTTAARPPSSSALPADCHSSGPVDAACAQRWLDDLTSTEGGGTAMAALLEAGDRYPDLATSCHTYAHRIGERAFPRYATIDAAFADGNPTCQFGYYHGALIAVAKQASSPAAFGQEAPTLCDFFTSVPFSYSSCVHGIGHAAAALLPDDVDGAAALCDGMVDDASTFNCVTGAVMEWATVRVPSQLAAGALQPTELEGVCETMADAVTRDGCYREVSSAWLAANGSDFAAALATCDRVAGDDVTTCYYGVGFRAGAGMDGPRAIQACATGRPELRGVCLGGAAVTVYEGLYRTEPDRADTVCPMVAPADRDECNRRLDRTKASYRTLATEVGESGYTHQVDTQPRAS